MMKIVQVKTCEGIETLIWYQEALVSLTDLNETALFYNEKAALGVMRLKAAARKDPWARKILTLLELARQPQPM